MFDNNITRPNITNGAQSKERNTTNKNKSKDNNSSQSFSQMFRDFADKLKAAESAEAKSQKNASNVVDKFIGNLRKLDESTRKKVTDSINSMSLDEIMRPDITNGAHSPERNGAKSGSDKSQQKVDNSKDWDFIRKMREFLDRFSPNTLGPFVAGLEKGRVNEQDEESVIDEYGNYKLSDGRGVLSVNPEALAEENANNASRQNMNAGREMMLPAKKTLVYAGNGKSGGPRVTIPDDVEDVEYTYQSGDTFAQFLLNSGLSDGSNLWGPNGDVEYYRKQLAEQGYTGNIPVGTKIRLKKRK